MGLKDFQLDDDDEEEKDQETEEETTDNEVKQKQEESTKEHIASNIRHRVRQQDMDIDLEDGRIEGDINDIAMLFALMTMDIPDSYFDTLINDGE
ncbi:MAG: hypothetical protein J07AB43_02300 [Candidatus Nanosalina sp. J07AB43]|jgi:hypothetical protein|nr:MAG: hypothetical protein J07AB43_02300 [Candidatus Nanosalina sp. J07AB43]